MTQGTVTSGPTGVGPYRRDALARETAGQAGPWWRRLWRAFRCAIDEHPEEAVTNFYEIHRCAACGRGWSTV